MKIYHAPKAPVQYDDEYHLDDAVILTNGIMATEGLVFHSKLEADAVYNYLYTNLGPVTDENIGAVIQDWQKKHAKSN